MLYVVAPFESENICKKISSRNIELIRVYNENDHAVLLLSRFNHRYKIFNSKEDIVDGLNYFEVDFKIINTISYKKNISILRFLSNLFFSIKLFSYLLVNINKNDKLVINSIPPEILLCSRILKYFKGFELIVDVRDIWPDALVNITKNQGLVFKVFRFYCDIIYKSCLNSVDKFIYVAPSFVSWINRYSKGIKSKVFIPLGYDENRWNRDFSGVEDINLDVNNINFVYVGYLSEQFDLENIIKAFVASSANVKLYILGGGEKLDFYKQLAKQSTRVVFYGMVDPLYISKNLIKFDVGILPLKEGAGALLPNKYFDYIAAELPIMSFGSNDVNKLLADNGVGWVLKNNVQFICDFICKINMNDIVNLKNNVKTIRGSMSMQYMYNDLKSFILT